jgi:hypothetical protein
MPTASSWGIGRLYYVEHGYFIYLQRAMHSHLNLHEQQPPDIISKPYNKCYDVPS